MEAPPLIPSPYAGVRNSGPSAGGIKGKGTHIGTIKSLGLVHDLQVWQHPPPALQFRAWTNAIASVRSLVHVRLPLRGAKHSFNARFSMWPMILQDYIVSMETLALEQRRELDRVKEEKKDLERVSRTACL